MDLREWVAVLLGWAVARQVWVAVLVEQQGAAPALFSLVHKVVLLGQQRLPVPT